MADQQTEGIRFNPVGTVDVWWDGYQTTLGRPKFRQYQHFASSQDKMREALQAAAETVVELRDRLNNADLSDKDASKIRSQLADVNQPTYEFTLPLLVDMFNQLGSEPLPEDTGDWPAWLVADVSIPTQILNHWRSAPKASGSTATT